MSPHVSIIPMADWLLRHGHVAAYLSISPLMALFCAGIGWSFGKASVAPGTLRRDSWGTYGDLFRLPPVRALLGSMFLLSLRSAPPSNPTSADLDPPRRVNAVESRICAYCGGELGETEIRHRRRLFCSDECCEAFEDSFLVRGEPDPTDLAEGEVVDDDLDLDAEDLDDDELEDDELDDDFLPDDEEDL